MIRHISIVILISSTFTIYSQEDRIEFVAEGAGLNTDLSELTDKLEYYKANPLNINTAEIAELESLQLLDPIAIQSLNEYREEYGSLLTMYELLGIRGFDHETVSALLPYITLEQTTRANIKNRFKDQLIIRYSRVLEKQLGYRNISPDEWQQRPNARYIGAPDRLYIRNALSWGNLLKAGFTMDKDAGEPMIQRDLPDTISTNIKIRNVAGFDFVSAYACIQDFKFIKKIVLGDYHLQFGQGVTIWSGMAYGKSADVTNIKKYEGIIRPNTASNENNYMRGIAAWLQFGSFGLISYYSKTRFDAGQGSGYHRTYNEIIDRHSLNAVNYGGRIYYRHNHFKAGVILNLSRFSPELTSTDQLYNQFKARGHKFANFGVDYDIRLFRHSNLFGEISASQNLSVAFITGLISLLHPKISIAMVFRNYPADHIGIHGGGFSEAGYIQNEKGFYLGISVNPLPRLTIKAYADLYTFPWIRYQVDAPSSGYDLLIQATYTLNRCVQFYCRYRTETRTYNSNDGISYIDPVIDRKKQILRFHISYQVCQNLLLRCRAEWNKTYPDSFEGFLIYQDFIFKPENKLLQIIARVALFDTDTYENRIYAYENDVLYASSVPSYYGQGTRLYTIYNLHCTKFLDLYIRLAQTYYFDRNVIGTGLDEINGRSKTEIKLQLRLKI